MITTLTLSFWAGFVTRLIWPGQLISRVNVLDVAVGLVVLIALLRHWRHIAIDRWLAAWLALVALSAFWGAARFGWSLDTFAYIIRVSIYGLFFGVAARWPVGWRRKWMAWLGAGAAIVGLLQLAVWPTIPVSMIATHGFDPHSGRLFALWFDPNIAAALLMLTSLATVSLIKTESGRSRWIFSGLLLIQLMAIFQTDSRSGWLSLGLALAYWMLVAGRRLLLLLLATIIVLPLLSTSVASRLAGLFNFDDTSVARVVSWQNGFRVVEQSPVIGVGYNYYRPASEVEGTLRLRVGQVNLAANGSDSSLLTVWATTGLLGLAIFLTAVISGGWRRRSAVARASVIGIIVNSLFINSLLLGPVWFLLALIWASED